MDIKYKNSSNWSITVLNIELGKLELIKKYIEKHLLTKYPHYKNEIIYIQDIKLLEINKSMRATTILRLAIFYTVPTLD